ncbi:MAG: hypothetical protein AAFR81_01630 [Chloroflexota bacterium]
MSEKFKRKRFAQRNRLMGCGGIVVCSIIVIALIWVLIPDRIFKQLPDVLLPPACSYSDIRAFVTEPELHVRLTRNLIAETRATIALPSDDRLCTLSGETYSGVKGNDFHFSPDRTHVAFDVMLGMLFEEVDEDGAYGEYLGSHVFIVDVAYGTTSYYDDISSSSDLISLHWAPTGEFLVVESSELVVSSNWRAIMLTFLDTEAQVIWRDSVGINTQEDNRLSWNADGTEFTFDHPDPAESDCIITRENILNQDYICEVVPH